MYQQMKRVSMALALGSVTDLDGNFSINGVNPSSVLKFTYIGYKEKKVR